MYEQVWYSTMDKYFSQTFQRSMCPDSKVHGANMGPIWGRQMLAPWTLLSGVGHSCGYISWSPILSQIVATRLKIGFDLLVPDLQMSFMTSYYFHNVKDIGIENRIGAPGRHVMIWEVAITWYTLQWHNNERYGVSNHRCIDCLLNWLFRCSSMKTSKLRVTGFVRGIHRRPLNSPHIEPVRRKMFPFYDVIMIWRETNVTFNPYLSRYFKILKYLEISLII